MCVCLRCGPLAFEATLAVCRQSVGQGVRGKERAEKQEEKSSLKVGKVVFVFDSNSI